MQEGKRSKLETETSTSTRSSSHDQPDRASGRRISSAQADAVPGRPGSESSPPAGVARHPSGPLLSKSTSPVAHPLSGFHSPGMGDHYSPIGASPRLVTLQKEGSYEGSPSAVARESRGASDASSRYSPIAYGHPPPQPSSTMPPAASYPSHYQAPIELPSRRSMREPTRLPTLTHEETTLSSDSGHSYHPPYTGMPFPAMDASKHPRMLPAPIPSAGATPSPLDRLPSQVASPHQTQPEFRTSSSLAALLIAGELARVADDEEMDKEGSP